MCSSAPTIHSITPIADPTAAQTFNIQAHQAATTTVFHIPRLQLLLALQGPGGHSGVEHPPFMGANKLGCSWHGYFFVAWAFEL